MKAEALNELAPRVLSEFDAHPHTIREIAEGMGEKRDNVAAAIKALVAGGSLEQVGQRPQPNGFGRPSNLYQRAL